MARPKGVIGIDLGTETVKVVALEKAGGVENLPKVLGVGAAPSEGLKRGIVMDSESVGKSIRRAMESLEKNTGIKSGAAYAGSGGGGLVLQRAKGLVVISRADGTVSKEDAKRAVATSETNLSRAQNREILHKIPHIFKIDNETETHDPLGLVGSKLEAETLFITLFSQNFKSVLKAFDEADLEVENIVANPFASAYSALSKREREVGAAVIDIGASTTSVMLFEEGFPYSLEVFPFGSAHITNDIAMGFQITLEEAEKLKLNYGAVGDALINSKKDDLVHGDYSKKKLSTIIEARLGDIFELIEKHLKKVERAGLLPAGVAISGGGANLPGIVEYAKEYLKLPAHSAEAPSLGGFRDKIKNPAWHTALGIALWAFEETEGASQLLSGKSASVVRWLRAFLP